MEKSLNKNVITALGTGTSTGIPMVGCFCSVCTSVDHRDQRLRTSLFIETKKGQKILVDTSPDLRTQLLTNKISVIDSIILTHAHADHLHGIDDVRPLTFGPPKKIIPLYTNQETALNLRTRFSYVFPNENEDKPILGGGIPRISLHEVALEANVTINGESFYFFNYPHGHGETMGFVHEGLAYIVDCMELTDEKIDFLKSKKLDLLIIDCLQRSTHTTHLTVEKSFDYIQRISPKKTGLIHMGHDLSHRVISDLAFKRFGDKVFPLYDQQKLFY
jgi:phosphoribosyl 1,2-cyclic phosphate phosphodiesterase